MSVVFFTDRDLGLAFPNFLRTAGLAVEIHQEHFAANTPDEEWLRETARRGWVAISHDARIRYKPNELAAVRRHKAALLVLIGYTSNVDLATNFVRTQSKIFDFVAARRRPFIAKVYRPTESETTENAEASGRVELWYP